MTLPWRYQPASPARAIFQSLALGLAPFLARGDLVSILPEWSEELYPLYAYHASRHLPPAKVRAFLDFIQEIAVGPQVCFPP
jgi:DNA-binding transcriptional LysR family regulator